MVETHGHASLQKCVYQGGGQNREVSTKRNAQCETCESGFIGHKMRTIALESGSQIALRTTPRR